MSSLKYAGRVGTTNNQIVSRLSVDQAFASGITRGSVDDSVALIADTKARTDYVDAQDANLATTGYVSQQDGLLVPASKKGAINGVASLDANKYIPTTQLPPMGRGKIRGPYGLTSRNAGTASPSSSGSGASNYAKIGSWNLPAPGFVWRPMVFMTCLVGAWRTADKAIAEGRADVECRVGGSYNSTICASGRGSLNVRGYQGVNVQPNTDLKSQTGASFSGYPSTYAVDIGAFVYQYFGGATAELGDASYIFSAALFLIQISD